MDYSALGPEELLGVCLEDGQTSAWDEFIRRFNPVVTRTVLRTARRWGDCSRPLLQDLVQETYLKLCSDNCRLLRNFENRQPNAIFGFLKVVSANVVHDHFKAAHASKRGSGRPESDQEADAAVPSYSGIASMDREVLIQQIDQRLAQIVPSEELARTRLIFWLHYRAGLSAGAIASLPTVGLTRKGVESAILRWTRLLRCMLAEQSSSSPEQQKKSASSQEGYVEA
jgi:RNA polymerase sigma-70 factor, ECF subfamily